MNLKFWKALRSSCGRITEVRNTEIWLTEVSAAEQNMRNRVIDLSLFFFFFLFYCYPIWFEILYIQTRVCDSNGHYTPPFIKTKVNYCKSIYQAWIASYKKKVYGIYYGFSLKIYISLVAIKWSLEVYFLLLFHGIP